MVKNISVAEFEAKVLEKEEIVIKVRAASGEKVLDYTYDRKAGESINYRLARRPD